MSKARREARQLELPDIPATIPCNKVELQSTFGTNGGDRVICRYYLRDFTLKERNPVGSIVVTIDKVPNRPEGTVEQWAVSGVTYEKTMDWQDVLERRVKSRIELLERLLLGQLVKFDFARGTVTANLSI